MRCVRQSQLPPTGVASSAATGHNKPPAAHRQRVRQQPHLAPAYTDSAARLREGVPRPGRSVARVARQHPGTHHNHQQPPMQPSPPTPPTPTPLPHTPVQAQRYRLHAPAFYVGCSGVPTADHMPPRHHSRSTRTSPVPAPGTTGDRDVPNASALKRQTATQVAFICGLEGTQDTQHTTPPSPRALNTTKPTQQPEA